MSDDERLDSLKQRAEEVRRQIVRARAQLRARREELKEGRRRYARAYYARNRAALLEYQRQQRALRRERDPERYRRLKRESFSRWRATHHEEHKATQRARYRQDPETYRQRSRRYYAEHADEVRAARRERYAANREQELEKQRARRAADKRRRDAGLPAVRLHRATAPERAANDAAADAFFSQRWPAWVKDRLRAGPPTPPQLLAAFARDCKRARAAFYLAEQRDVLRRLDREVNRARPGPKPRPTLTPQQERVAEQEAIGKAINDRLRHHDPPRRAHHNDPAAPVTVPTPIRPTGMNR